MPGNMKNNIHVNKADRFIRLIISCLVFLLLCIVLLISTSGLFQPKYYFAADLKSPETEMWENFYDLPENSLTTVFVGDSSVYCGVDTARFNSLTGESSFDLAVSSGCFMEGYYMLQELLRYQKPKTVVLDMNSVTRDYSKNAVMSMRPFQDMKWSKVKWDALTDKNRGLGKKDILMRIFTIFEYHDRWKELSDVDVHPDMYKTNVLGYAPSNDIGEGLYHDRFSIEEDLEYNEIPSYYFDKIVSLCDEHDMKLILIKVPKIDWNISHMELSEDLAEEYGLDYIDYNVDTNYYRIGIDDEKDWRDASHLNVHGAKKFTDILAEDLQILSTSAPRRHAVEQF